MFLLTISNNAQTGKEKHYYYSEKKQIPLEINTDYIYVSLKENYSKSALESFVSKNNLSLVTLEEDYTYNFITAIKQPTQKSYCSKIKLNSPISVSEYQQLISRLKLLNDVLYVSPYFNNKDTHGEIGITQNIKVKLRSINDIDLLEETAKKYNTEVIGYNSFNTIWYTIVCKANSKYNSLEIANAFYESGLFESALPEFIHIIHENSNAPDVLKQMNFSNDTYYNDQWGHHNTGQNGGIAGIDIKAEEAWTVTQGSANIKVAVFDSGYQLNHPDLASNNFGLGYDTYTGGTSQVWGDHGTACAGIIAAIKDNGIGIAGVAPNCKITSISIKFGTGGSTYTGLANGFYWAVANGMKVISNSWGGGSVNDELNDAISAALAANIVVVFSSGNNNMSTGEYPGNSNPLIINVGAIDRCGIRSGRIDIIPQSCDPWGPGSYPASSYGSTLDVVGPGSSVTTTDRTGNAGYNPFNQPNYSNYDYTKSFGGTSSACPYVAGVAALVLSVNPYLTVQEVNNIIERSARKVRSDWYTYGNAAGRNNGLWNNQLGYGMVSAYKSVMLACPTNLVVTQSFTSLPIDEKQASETITASNILSPGTWNEYHAGRSITLVPGFFSNTANTFDAYILGCESTIAGRPAAMPEEIAENYTDNPAIEENYMEDMQELSIYPNPANSEINIKANENIRNIIIVTTDGKTVLEKNVSGESFDVLDITNFSKGMYIINIQTESDKIFSKKIIKN